MELLDVTGSGGERCDERRVVVPERLIGVQPAAELALLPPRQGNDPVRLVRMPLDQRERLQHRVVDAGGDVGALVAADSGGALGITVEREPPDPRAGDEEQRARDRSGCEQG